MVNKLNAKTLRDGVLVPFLHKNTFNVINVINLFLILFDLDPESFLSSDTWPETPDGSLKEEVDSPDTGAYICLWDLCHEEFETQKSFVDHLNDAHTETKKGCDEFPCLWKVRFS